MARSLPTSVHRSRNCFPVARQHGANLVATCLNDVIFVVRVPVWDAGLSLFPLRALLVVSTLGIAFYWFGPKKQRAVKSPTGRTDGALAKGGRLRGHLRQAAI